MTTITDDNILLKIKADVLKNMKDDPPTHAMLCEGFFALAVLMDAMVAFDATKKQYMYVLIQKWLDDIITDELYEQLATINGATIEHEQ
jgi:hypothetical protein